MKVIFMRANGEEVTICNNVESMEEAYITINMFLESKNYKSYYSRSWEENGRIFVDVGSHTEFFIIDGVKEFEETEKVEKIEEIGVVE